jgi:hypothetical protein
MQTAALANRNMVRNISLVHKKFLDADKSPRYKIVIKKSSYIRNFSWNQFDERDNLKASNLGWRKHLAVLKREQCTKQLFIPTSKIIGNEIYRRNHKMIVIQQFIAHRNAFRCW